MAMDARKLWLELELENAAFQDGWGYLGVAETVKLAVGMLPQSLQWDGKIGTAKIQDTNGNTVGKIVVTK